MTLQNFSSARTKSTRTNQPGQLCGTAKTHKFDNTVDIRVDNLKFRLISSVWAKHIYNAAQVIANYFKPLCSNNEYIIRNTPEFAKTIHEQDPYKSNEQYVSYDMESLFTNSPVYETMEYIINEIYVVSKISKLCSKLLFKLLLLKLTTENTFMLNSRFFNSNHPNIKYTIERDPDKLLDTKIFQENGIMSTEVNRKD